MHKALWFAQAFLALVFLMAGGMKAATPPADLAAMMPWVGDAPGWAPRVIGLAEVLGAIGLILPSALRIQPRLTVAAASGLGLVMLLAIPMHIAYGEAASVPVNLFFLGLAAFVAWGRGVRAPIEAR
jgi:putative oxidoreductase